MHDEIITNDRETPALTCGPVAYGPIEYSSPVGNLMRALALAQAEMTNPEHDSTNYYGKGYASMAAVRNAVLPVLTKYGIAVTQFPDFREGVAGCITILWYGEQYLRSQVACRVVKTNTEWKDRVKTSVLVPVAELTHQDSTGPFSYLRRIALKAIAGIADEEDDAGEKVPERRGEETPTGQAATTPGSARSSQGRQEQAPAPRPAGERPTPHPTAAAEAAMQAETDRQALLSDIWVLYRDAVQPLKHAGMYKALFFHCFHLDKPERIKDAPLETLAGGMALYRHLTAQLVTWDRHLAPHVWIDEQQRRLATEIQSESPVPAGVDPATGEDTRALPTEWLTAEERRAQPAREEAVLLAPAEHAS